MAPNLLSDGRLMRAMEGLVNQEGMFNNRAGRFTVRGKFNPQIEGIAKLREVDDAFNKSRIYPAVMGQTWVRTDEYTVYRRDPKEPLGKEVAWVESGIRYNLLVPDIKLQFNGKEVSLQKVTAMGVFDSIGLLKIEQNDENLFTVSAVDEAALAEKVRAVDFMRRDIVEGNWALTDKHGFPLGSKPARSDNPDSRCTHVRSDYENGATGWHGSIGYSSGGRLVSACDFWGMMSNVAIVGHSPLPGFFHCWD